MKKSRTVIRRRQSSSPALRHLPLVDILVDTQTELQALVVASGLKVLEAMLEEVRSIKSFDRPHWLYHRFCLSFRDTEDLLAQRGITVTYETIRQWCRSFGPAYARTLRRRRGRMGDTWYLDELFVNIQGRQQYLWRAVDEDGDVIDILVQSRRDRRAAERFLRKLLKGQGREPRRLITDKLRSYSAAHRTVLPLVVHSTEQYQNNRAEVSHQPTRQRERQMRRFKSAWHAQRFLSVHGLIQNLFRVGRHLLRAVHHRSLRTRSFRVWDEVTCAY